MKTASLASLCLAFAGCVSSPDVPVSDLHDTDLEIWVDELANGQFELYVTKPDQSVGTSWTGECVRLRDTISVTANSVEGALVTPGGDDSQQTQEPEYLGANSCMDPHMTVSLGGRPSTVAIMLDDGTAEIEVDLALDARRNYQVTRCGAVRCVAPPATR